MNKEIKHYIDVNGMYCVVVDDVLVMSVELDKELGHVVIKTPKEVYAGPVDLISFKE